MHVTPTHAARMALLDDHHRPQHPRCHACNGATPHASVVTPPRRSRSCRPFRLAALFPQHLSRLPGRHGRTPPACSAAHHPIRSGYTVQRHMQTAVALEAASGTTTRASHVRGACHLPCQLPHFSTACYSGRSAGQWLPPIMPATGRSAPTRCTVGPRGTPHLWPPLCRSDQAHRTGCARCASTPPALLNKHAHNLTFV